MALIQLSNSPGSSRSPPVQEKVGLVTMDADDGCSDLSDTAPGHGRVFMFLQV